MKLYLISGLMAGVALLPLSAKAQTSYPTLSGEAVFELQNEYTVDSDDQTTDEYNNMFFRSEVAPTLQLNENFFIDGVAVFENIQDRKASRHNFFNNEGAFIEEIKLNYQNGPWAAMAGKFNPMFGTAWDYGRGIWGEDFAEDYEITEKIGVGGAYTFEDSNYGSHTLAASSFFADTTIFSQSKITDRDDLDINDGGVSNTEDFGSFVFSLEGSDIPTIPNLYYQIAYRNQAEGEKDTGTDRETGIVGTLGYIHTVNDDVSLDMVLEYADINNFETADADNQYLFANMIARFNNGWNVTLGYTGRDIDSASGDSEDHLLQLSGGYDFGQGTTAEIGWRNSEEGGTDTDIIGGLIRHSIYF